MIIGLVGSLVNCQNTHYEIEQLAVQSAIAVSLDGSYGTQLTERDLKRLQVSRSELGVVYIRSPAQADTVRLLGGVVWHLLGYPPYDISITGADIMVAIPPKEPAGRLKSTDEALSDCLARIWTPTIKRK